MSAGLLLSVRKERQKGLPILSESEVLGMDGPEGIRTLGLCVANAALSQLSYEPIVETVGLEPTTSRV